MLMRTWSLMVSSVILGGSFATASTVSRKQASRTTAILLIIFSGHCTPVQSVEKGAVFAPPRFHLHVEIQEDLHVEQALHLLTCQSANLCQHGSAGAEYNPLLAFALHADGGVKPGDLGSLFPLVHADGN